MRRITRSSIPVALVLFVLLAGSTVLAQTAVFRRGDANGDSSLDVSDAVFTLRFLFAGGTQGRCHDAADANDDGTLDIADPAYSLFYLFAGGPAPSPPGFQCGVDLTEDTLSCDEYLPCGHLGRHGTLATLKPVHNCGEVADQLRQRVMEDMETRLAENLALVIEIVRGGGCRSFRDRGPVLAGGIPAPPGGPEGAGDAAGEYTGTNNQIEGVDEADFVKTDGAYIYILAAGKFQIIDAWPAPEARKVAAVDVGGTPKKLFVDNDRAVVYSSLEPIQESPDVRAGNWDPVHGRGECTYGYDCDFTGDGRKLKVTVFDISDRTLPTLIREIEFSGSYLSSRRIGDIVYTVAIFPEIIVPGLSYWPEQLATYWNHCWGPPLPYTEDDVRAMFAELRSTNVMLIDNTSITDLLPSVTDKRYQGETVLLREGLLQDCRDFYVSQSGDGQSLLSLVSFHIGELRDPETTTIVGKPGAVYASRDSLYIATRHYGWEVDRWYFESREQNPEATTIHKFRLFPDRAGSSYVGSGAVKGRILNQFSMDEYQGHLRVATTTGRVPSPGVHSTVSVLAEQQEGLTLVGQVDHIAPTEDIRSVRFNGDVGFVVTFKKTDPLFVLDLADPGQPRIRGELKIPGFSTYMHLLDEGHLLSIGYDADDQGRFAWFQGVLLQILDVSDVENPSLVHREVIGTRGTTSDAATNHLAFNYFRSRGLLALPMVICEGEAGGGRYGDRMTFSGLMVYHVDLQNGFEFLGGVPHATPETGPDARRQCRNWWTNSNSQVKRSIFMEDFVFSVALDRINVSQLDDLDHPLASIFLGR